MLRLEGDVTMEQFDSIRLGRHPSTGEFLRPRQNVDRFDEDGKRTATARNLYDFTISAPKAVSVQALEDPRLIEAHHRAVNETVQEMENSAAARIRRLERRTTESRQIWSSPATITTPAVSSIHNCTLT